MSKRYLNLRTPGAHRPGSISDLDERRAAIDRGAIATLIHFPKRRSGLASYRSAGPVCRFMSKVCETKASGSRVMTQTRHWKASPSLQSRRPDLPGRPSVAAGHDRKSPSHYAPIVA
jgi:hypothetical protein